jgi:pimeloyl-ACP methyl ester carboxylesterase
MSGIVIQGRLVHYESFGRGKPVIFLHGWLGSWRYWVPVMDEMSTDRRAYALDLWGFGDSDKAMDRVDIDAYVDQCVAFMDALGIGKVPFVGHTLGAAVALRLAERCPERVDRIMAAALPLSADAINRKLLVAGPNDVLAREFWRRQKPYQEVQAGVSRTAHYAIALTVQSVARLQLRDTFQGLRVLLLAVYGDKDTIIDPAQAGELNGAERPFPARAIVLPGASHFPMLDATAKFTRLLRDFIGVTSANELLQLTIKEEWRRRTR